MSFRTVAVSFLSFSFLALQGCGPRIAYTYSPPYSEAGIHCTRECAIEQDQCKVLAEKKAASYSSWQQAQPMTPSFCTRPSDKNPMGTCSYSPPSPPRAAPGDTCLEDYQACYRGCGGAITRKVIHD